MSRPKLKVSHLLQGSNRPYRIRDLVRKKIIKDDYEFRKIDIISISGCYQTNEFIATTEKGSLSQN